MIVTIQPSRLHGTIHAAASKSSMQRACAAALLTNGVTTLVNPGKSNDDLSAIEVIRNLGAQVQDCADGSLKITSDGIHPVNDKINCGESGLGLRMFAPIASLSSRVITLTGTGSLLTRPMNFFDEILPRLGVKVHSSNGRLPIEVQGPLIPGDIEVDGSLSSQFLTGLLMAYGAARAANVTITVRDLTSKPYIDLTLQVMKHFGWEVQNEQYRHFHFPKALPDTETRSITYTVEGDWSGAAFLLVAGAVAGPVTVLGLAVDSTQADKAVLQALIDCGCRLSISDGQIEVSPLALRSFHFKADDCPDLFPPLVALAAYCEGTSVIEGVDRLAHKESNRALTLQQEFAKLGIDIILQGNIMLVKGGTGVKGVETFSHHDHRIAMACAVAALGADGVVHIREAGAVDKSYPDFYDHLQKLGACITTINPKIKST